MGLKTFTGWKAFTAGELTDLLDGAWDKEPYYRGCKVMENFVPLPQGPARTRPGLRYIVHAKNEIIALANALKTTMNAHAADATAHATADTVNFPIATDDVLNMYDAYALIGELLTAFNAHEADDNAGAGSYHNGIEGTDATLTSTTTPTTDAEAVTVLSDLLSKYNTHDADNTANVPHVAGNEHQETVGAPNASRKCRLYPFEFSTTQAYIIEIGHEYFRFFMNQGQIVTVDSFTKLLLEFNNEVDASTTFEDLGDTGHTPINALGNVQVDTEYKKFGSGACLFDGVNSRITVADHADFDLSASDGGIDLWVKPLPGNSGPYIIFHQDVGADATTYMAAYLDKHTGLLLNGNDVDAGQVIDSSLNTKTVSTVPIGGVVDIDAGGKFGAGCLDFNLAGLSVPGSADTNFGASPGTGDVFTIEFWVKPDSVAAPADDVFLLMSFDANNYIKIYQHFTEVYVEYKVSGSSTYFISGKHLNTSTFTHVVFAGDGTNLSLFTNGTRDKTAAKPGAMPSLAGSTVFIGTDSVAKLFSGKIDDFMISLNEKYDVGSATLTVPTTENRNICHAVFAISNAGVLDTIGMPLDDITPDKFHHVEINYDVSEPQVYMFTDGVLRNGAVAAMTQTASGSLDSVFAIGANRDGISNPFKGWMDEIRWSKGVLRHTADFVPNTAGYSSLGNTPYEVSHTYTESELPELQFAQSGDELYIFHPQHAPATLTRSDHTSWALADISFTATPASWGAGSYPSAGVFYENRLVMVYNQTVWGSVAGDYDNLTTGAGADDAFVYTLGSGKVNKAQWMVAAKKLFIGTAGGEHPMSASSDQEALTPINVKTVKETAYGSAYQMAVEVEDVVLFIQRAGRKIRELAANEFTEKYNAPDMTELAEHITKSYIVYMAYQQEPYSILWCVRNDGVLLGFTYNRANEIVAWHRHPLGNSGTIESVACIPGNSNYDELWAVVKRTINGATVRYVELMEGFEDGSDLSEYFCVDSGITYDGVSTTTITGLKHLEGETVSVLADGVALGDETVSSGQITIDSAAIKVHVGEPFETVLQTMRAEVATSQGTSQGKYKFQNRAVFRVKNGQYWKFGVTPTGDLLSHDEGSFISESTDIQKDMPLGLDRKGTITVKVDKPLPLTLIAMIPEMNIS